MPSGRTHAVATVITAGVAGPLLYLYAGSNIAASAAVSIGCAAGLLLTPDLDVQTGSLSFTLMRRSLRGLKGIGAVLAFFWQWFWQPYARLIPRHRHPLSHFPVIGTAGRLIYLILVAGALYWMAQSLWLFTGSILLLITGRSLGSLPAITSLFSLMDQPLLWWWLVGLALVDSLHTLMDWFWPFR